MLCDMIRGTLDRDTRAVDDLGRVREQGMATTNCAGAPASAICSPAALSGLSRNSGREGYSPSQR